MHHFAETSRKGIATDVALGCITPMEPIGEEIRRRRVALGWSQSALAHAAGASIRRNTVGRIERGEVQDPHDSTVSLVRAALDRGEGELQQALNGTGDGEEIASASRRPYFVNDADASRADPLAIGHNIPFTTRADAGGGMDYQRGIYADRYLPSALVPHAHWKPAAYVVTGDSMLPKFQPGDVLIVGHQLQGVRTDDYAVVGFKNGEHTFKRIRVIDEDTWELIPLNTEDYKPRVVKRHEEVEWVAPVLGRWEPIYQRRSVPWEETG